MVFEFSGQIGAGENSHIPGKSSTIHSLSNDTIFVSGNDKPHFLNCAGSRKFSGIKLFPIADMGRGVESQLISCSIQMFQA